MRYSRDPYWLQARFASKCRKCGAQIKRGERIFYYPIEKTAYCEKCGQAASAEFDAAAMDEAFLSM